MGERRGRKSMRTGGVEPWLTGNERRKRRRWKSSHLVLKFSDLPPWSAQSSKRSKGMLRDLRPILSLPAGRITICSSVASFLLSCPSFHRDCHQTGPTASSASVGLGDRLRVAAVPGLERADPARQGLLQDGADGERFLRPGRRLEKEEGG